jgi:hypothetical protein
MCVADWAELRERVVADELRLVVADWNSPDFAESRVLAAKAP